MMKMRFTLPNGECVEANLFDHSSAAEWKKEMEWAGHVVNAESSKIGFFRYENEIHVFVDGLVDYLANFEISNQKNDKTRRFRIAYRGQSIIDISYEAEEHYDINPFWPTDEEDVDDLLWFDLVLESDSRRQVILETCQNAKKV